MAIARPVTKTVISTTDWGIPITDAVNQASDVDIPALQAFMAANTPTAWVSVALGNGWSNATPPVQYRKVGDRVELRGRMQSGTMLVTVFTLPTGFRPPQTMQFPVGSADSGGNWIFGVVEVGSNGAVSVRAGQNNAITLNNIAFATA